jgi:hypothetical protein
MLKDESQLGAKCCSRMSLCTWSGAFLFLPAGRSLVEKLPAQFLKLALKQDVF